MTSRFVGEPIVPDAATCDTARMASGEPGLPGSFSWRGRTFRVERVVRTWRQTGPCRSGSPERYVRKHWYEVLTDSGATSLDEGGDIPWNCSGGVLSSNPIGASGTLRFAEAALQVRGQAEDRQVDGARRALAHALGGASQFFAMWVVGSEKP